MESEYGSDGEIFGLRVVDDDRRGRLLRLELVFLGKGDADLVGAQQREQLTLVGKIGACRVAERISAATVALLKHRVGVARLLGSKTELAANTPVQVFRQCL